MKLTEQDKQMFKSLKESGQGKWLADYCERLQAYICDCRYWEKDTDRNAMRNAADKIDAHIVGNLRNINKKSGLPDFK